MRDREFVESYLDAWNRHDAQAVADHLAENGRYLNIPFNLDLSRAELIKVLEVMFLEDNCYYRLHGEVLSGESTIAYQYEVFPRDAGEDERPASTWYGAEFITLSNGRAVEISDYYEQNNQFSPDSPMSGGATAALIKRYAKSGLSNKRQEELKAELTHLMEGERLYLRSDLTLPELAQALDCSVNHLSQAINAGFGMSFFDYLNQLRVNDAMRLLLEGGTDQGILDIALDVGFNSTSTFYVAFKKVTGQTPAQFRKARA